LCALPATLPSTAWAEDVRTGPLKDLNGYFPFAAPQSLSEWDARKEEVRRRILVAEGLWPMPTKTPLNAVIHGRVDCGDYVVEKAYFESAPGFFVTGNLYRPKNPKGKIPGVLFAHGHWKDARLSDNTPEKVRQEIAGGQERFEKGGRSRFQSLCVQVARMGCAVWQWDMLSDSDAIQFSSSVIHTFAKQRPEMNTAQNWGLYSPQAEAHAQSVMGLQTWNAVRSLDFLLSLPEVDPERTAITGSSGGGTQTMLLAAIDERIKLSFPVVMVSTAMQGGCTCENASLLRIDTGNVEFAALFAPKPQGMNTANDWTKELATKGFPEPSIPSLAKRMPSCSTGASIFPTTTTQSPAPPSSPSSTRSSNSGTPHPSSSRTLSRFRANNSPCGTAPTPPQRRPIRTSNAHCSAGSIWTPSSNCCRRQALQQDGASSSNPQSKSSSAEPSPPPAR
jgi:hypothetical protein